MPFIMQLRFFLAALSAAFVINSAGALTVKCAPGELNSLVANPAGVSELTLTGTADASDFYFIDSRMTALRSLDLSGLTIAAYLGDPVNGISEYPANTIPAMALAGSHITSLTLPSGAVSIGSHAFSGSALESLVVPANIVNMGTAAFGGCQSLKTVTVNTAAVGEYVFNNCPSLTTVTFGGTASVGASAFAGCSSLAAVKGSESLTAIGDGAFNGCSALEAFDFGAGLRSIGSLAFAHSGIAAADLENTKLSQLGAWAFAYNDALTSASLPATLSSVGEGAFFDCPHLSSLLMPQSLADMPDYMLKGTPSLVAATLPGGLSSIGNYAMKDASAMSSLTLPASLEYIGDNAMEGMTGLKTINATALSEVPALGADVWSDVDQKSVTLSVGENLADEFKASPQWQEFDVRSISTGADAPLADAAASTLRGRFSGATLLLESSGSPIELVQLFDVAGRKLASASPADFRAAIDTAQFDADIFIVNCLLADGSAATLKMAR